MLTVVLVANGLIGLVCLFVAWQLWQLRRRLAQVTETLTSVERVIYNIFHPAPGYIYKGQTGIRQLRQNYGKLEPQLQQVQQVLSLLGFGRMLWMRRSRLSRPRNSGPERDR